MSNLKMQLIVAKSTVIIFWLATALSATSAVTLLVSDRPRRPGIIPSIYRGPPTYDGSKLKTSASSPYIIVSRRTLKDCEQYHNHYNEFSHHHYPPSIDEYHFQPFIKPIIERGRQFSYNYKQHQKNKHYAGIKMLQLPQSPINHLQSKTNHGQSEFNGKWEIIKPPLKPDSEGRLVTYNADGTRVLPEPIYNYHKREMQLLWSPLQKGHRFDDNERQWIVKEALPGTVNKVNSVETSPPLQSPQTLTTHLPTLATTDNGVGSSTVSQIINLATSTVQMPLNPTTTPLTTQTIRNLTDDVVADKFITPKNESINKVKNTNFFDKLSENAKSVFADIFNNFLSDKKLNKSRMGIDNNNHIYSDSLNNTVTQFNESELSLSQNNIDNEKVHSLSTVFPSIVIEVNNTGSEQKFSEEIDPTSISGWRPLIKPQLTGADDHNHYATLPSASSHSVSDFEAYDYDYNDTVDDKQSIDTDISNVDNFTTTENTEINIISTKTPRLPSFVNKTIPSQPESRFESPIEWLFGSRNGSKGVIGNETSMDNINEVSVDVDDAKNSAEDDEIDHSAYSNVSTIILIPPSNWTNDIEKIETTTVAALNNETVTSSKILTRDEAIDQVKETYKKVRFGIPFPFNLLHSFVKHL
ncbi:hypothetical protein CHUAL_005315 [Chamberlinius hualienensis]